MTLRGRVLKATVRALVLTLKTGREATRAMVWMGLLEGLAEQRVGQQEGG